MELKLTENIPSKKNSKIISCRGKFPLVLSSNKYREWHKKASEEILNQTPIKSIKKCNIELVFSPPNKRLFDLTNKAESVMDLLVDNGIIIDDNYSVVEELILKKGNFDFSCLIKLYDTSIQS